MEATGASTSTGEVGPSARPPSLVLRLKASRKKQPHRRWIRSWKGFESHKEEIRALAQEVARSDLEVRRLFPSSVATGLICEAMRDVSSASCPEVARAAKAQNELYALHSLLVSKGLDFDFVRREWATVLDPRQEERDLCDKLVHVGEKEEEELILQQVTDLSVTDQ